MSKDSRRAAQLKKLIKSGHESMRVGNFALSVKAFEKAYQAYEVRCDARWTMHLLQNLLGYFVLVCFVIDLHKLSFF